jgi:hypothetical protein
MKLFELEESIKHQKDYYNINSLAMEQGGLKIIMETTLINDAAIILEKIFLNKFIAHVKPNEDHFVIFVFEV